MTRRTPRTPFEVSGWPQSSGRTFCRAHTDPVIATIEASLSALADPSRAAQEKRYLKSDLRHLGVSLPAMRKVAAGAAKGLSREETLAGATIQLVPLKMLPA